MTTLNITGNATNQAGLVTPFSGTITIVDLVPPVIDGVTVNPQSAPAGTLRTITINAHDPQGQPLTYSLQGRWRGCTANRATQRLYVRGLSHG